MALTPTMVRDIFTAEQEYWRARKHIDAISYALYVSRYQDGVMKTPRGFEIVESHVAALYSRDPGVVLGPSLRGDGNTTDMQEILAPLVAASRQVDEQMSRIADIFPCAFKKLYPVESPDILRRTRQSALLPWEVIVDPQARTWEDMRWVGHIAYLPVEDAKTRYGNKRFSTRAWQDTAINGDITKLITGIKDTEVVGEFVLIVEMYDLRDDVMRVWSPDYDNGESWLAKGVNVEVGTMLSGTDVDKSEETDREVETEFYDRIPLRTASGVGIPPIIPLYFARDPLYPLRGLSLLERNIPLLSSYNQLFTRRKDYADIAVNQYLYKKGVLDESGEQAIMDASMGAMIAVQDTGDVSGAVMPLPYREMPSDLVTMMIALESELARTALIGPNQRGEVTGSTATEAGLVAQTSATIIGRMARERDDMIAQTARCLALWLGLYLGGEKERFQGRDGRIIILTQEMCEADYRYYALDAGSTPFADAERRQNLERLAPLLMQAGVPSSVIIAELVRAYGFPDTFKVPDKQVQPDAQNSSPEGDNVV